jgi:hypothetical protein
MNGLTKTNDDLSEEIREIQEEVDVLNQQL